MKVEIDTPYIKLDSLLKYAGVVDTGGVAKFLIEDGVVFVNGNKTTARGKKVTKGDIVTIYLNKKIILTVE
jgi:ribosome-associated protein